MAAAAAAVGLLVLLLAMGAEFLFQQGRAVGVGNLVIIGMDFGKGQEAMAVAAIFHEGGLKRRLDARHFRQIDIAA